MNKGQSVLTLSQLIAIFRGRLSLVDREWRVFAPLAVISICVGVLLRCLRLGLPMLTADEAFTWRLVTGSWDGLLIKVARDVHPPLYFIVCKVWGGVFGASIGALRSFSVTAGIVTLGAVYALVKDSLRLSSVSSSSRRLAGAFSVVLLSLHLGQIEASRTARMYSLVVLLMTLSCWLVLRAVESGRRGWWIAYGISVSAAAYTHYFAILGVFGQLIFVILAMCKWPSVNSKNQRYPDRSATVATGALLAVGIAAASYSPWICTLLWQVRDVQKSYWIPPLTLRGIVAHTQVWATGLAVPEFVDEKAWIALGILFVCLVIPILRLSSGTFFFLQAITPWIAVVVIHVVFHRSLLQVRYLWPAHVGVVGMASMILVGYRTSRQRIIFGCLFGLPFLLEAVAVVPKIPHESVVLQKVVAYLSRESAPGDLVVVDHPAGVNCLAYYCRQRTQPYHLDIRWLMRSPTSVGHVVHVASLSGRDVCYWLDGIPPESLTRFWQASQDVPILAPVPVGWSVSREKVFPYGLDGNRRYGVRLLVRDKELFAPREKKRNGEDGYLEAR